MKAGGNLALCNFSMQAREEVQMQKESKCVSDLLFFHGLWLHDNDDIQYVIGHTV